MRVVKGRSRRQTRRERNRAVFEALEPRVLLTVTYVHDTGSIATNGTNLQSAINAAALGDTIVLDAGVVYFAPTGGNGFTLPYKTGTGTLTIQTDHLSSLPEGVRVSAAVSQYMAMLETRGGNAPVIKTVLKDSAGNTVTTGAHDYALLGLEIAPQHANDSLQSLVILGDGTSAQSTVTAEAHHITIDRCYIHGLDPVSATVYANYQSAAFSR